MPALTGRNTPVHSHKAVHTLPHMYSVSDCAERLQSRKSSERERETDWLWKNFLLLTNMKQNWKEIKGAFSLEREQQERNWLGGIQTVCALCVWIRVWICVAVCQRGLLILVLPCMTGVLQCMSVCACGMMLSRAFPNQRGSPLLSAQQLMGNHYGSWQMASSWLPRQPHWLHPSWKWWCLRNGLLSKPSLSVMASLIGVMHKWIRIRWRLWFR